MPTGIHSQQALQSPWQRCGKKHHHQHNPPPPIIITSSLIYRQDAEKLEVVSDSPRSQKPQAHFYTRRCANTPSSKKAAVAFEPTSAAYLHVSHDIIFFFLKNKRSEIIHVRGIELCLLQSRHPEEDPLRLHSLPPAVFSLPTDRRIGKQIRIDSMPQ